MKSPYAHIFTALADGETEFEWLYDGTWEPLTLGRLFGAIQNNLLPPEHLRVKQETININGHSVPAPLKTLPEEGTYVYWPSFGFVAGPANTECVRVNSKNDTLTDVLLSYGLLHLTEEDASAHAKALISFTEVKS